MVEMEMLAEHNVRGDLAGLLLAAADNSGRTRTDIGKVAGIHKDALRRMRILYCFWSLAVNAHQIGYTRT